MAPVPEAELLRLTIAELDGTIFMEQGRITRLLEANPNATPQQLAPELTRYYNLLTRRHVLELMRTYPNVKVLYQVEFLGVRDADGNWIDRPRKRGRIADGALQVDVLQPVEVKTQGEILRAVPKRSQRLVNEFLASSKLGKQISVERHLQKWGNKKGVGFWFVAQDPLSLRTFEFEVPVENVRISRVQRYMIMGDGIEVSSLSKPPPGGGTGGKPPPKKPLKPTSRTAVDGRATMDPRIDARTEQAPKQKRQAGEAPRYRFQGGMPAPSGPTPRYDQLLHPDPIEALESNARTKGAVEGAIMMIYSKQLSHMHEMAKEKADAAVRSRMWEINRWREEGEYVVVRVTFAEPITKDVFGMETDSYPIFWGVEVAHTPPIRRPDGAEVSVEKLLEHARSGHERYRVRGEKDDVNRKVPPGRMLKTYDYAIYPPLPAGTSSIELLPLSALRPTDPFYFQYQFLEQQKRRKNEKWRGVMDRCKE